MLDRGRPGRSRNAQGHRCRFDGPRRCAETFEGPTKSAAPRIVTQSLVYAMGRTEHRRRGAKTSSPRPGRNGARARRGTTPRHRRDPRGSFRTGGVPEATTSKWISAGPSAARGYAVAAIDYRMIGDEPFVAPPYSQFARAAEASALSRTVEADRAELVRSGSSGGRSYGCRPSMDRGARSRAPDQPEADRAARRLSGRSNGAQPCLSARRRPDEATSHRRGERRAGRVAER